MVAAPAAGLNELGASQRADEDVAGVTPPDYPTFRSQSAPPSRRHTICSTARRHLFGFFEKSEDMFEGGAELSKGEEEEEPTEVPKDLSFEVPKDLSFTMPMRRKSAVQAAAQIRDAEAKAEMKARQEARKTQERGER